MRELHTSHLTAVFFALQSSNSNKASATDLVSPSYLVIIRCFPENSSSWESEQYLRSSWANSKSKSIGFEFTGLKNVGRQQEDSEFRNTPPIKKHPSWNFGFLLLLLEGVAMGFLLLGLHPPSQWAVLQRVVIDFPAHCLEKENGWLSHWGKLASKGNASSSLHCKARRNHRTKQLFWSSYAWGVWVAAEQRARSLLRLTSELCLSSSHRLFLRQRHLLWRNPAQLWTLLLAACSVLLCSASKSWVSRKELSEIGTGIWALHPAFTLFSVRKQGFRRPTGCLKYLYLKQQKWNKNPSCR